MCDNILSNLSSQFNPPNNDPYPPTVDLASDQNSEVLPDQGSQPEDNALVDVNPEPRITSEGYGSREFALEFPSHLHSFGDDPDTDSGVSLVVNLGTARHAHTASVWARTRADCLALEAPTASRTKEIATQSTVLSERMTCCVSRIHHPDRVSGDCEHQVPRRAALNSPVSDAASLEQIQC